MNVSGVSCAQQTSATSGASALRDQMSSIMSAVAKKLGMSDSDLQSALKSGKSLTDIAKSKGVSATDLVSTIKDAIKADDPNLTDAQVTNIANRVVNHKGGHHHHHGGGTPPVSATDPSTSSSSSSSSTDSTSLAALL